MARDLIGHLTLCTRFRSGQAPRCAAKAAAILIVASNALACGNVADTSASSSTAGAQGGAVGAGGAGGAGGSAARGAGGSGGAVDAGGAGGGAAGGGTGCPSEVSPEPGLVITAYGAVRGELAGDTYLYKGIPFAAPPVGP